MSNLIKGMELKSTKTNNTYIVEEMNEVSNKIYLNCLNDNEVAEIHILSKVIEYVESGYYTIVNNNKIVTDIGGRVLIKSSENFGKNKGTRNQLWYKVTTTKKGNFVTIDKKKVNLNTLQQEPYTFNNGREDVTVSSFIYVQD